MTTIQSPFASLVTGLLNHIPLDMNGGDSTIHTAPYMVDKAPSIPFGISGGHTAAGTVVDTLECHQQKYKRLFWALRNFWKWQKRQKLGRGFCFPQAWPKSSEGLLEGHCPRHGPMAIAFTAPVIPVFVAVVIALSSSHSHIIVIFMVTLLSTGSGGSGSDVEVDLVNMWQAHTRQQQEAWVHAEQEWQGVRRWLAWQGGLWMQKWRCMVGHRDGLHVLPRRVWAHHNGEVAMGRKCGEKAGWHSGL
ncbi:hypothetical protein EDB83DRAFT_2317392 [Lactarius deliciosus]|nr:hypothetical protein EDB83DRAFT_2317392 [Lactarius deliciosus]